MDKYVNLNNETKLFTIKVVKIPAELSTVVVQSIGGSEGPPGFCVVTSTGFWIAK